MLLPFKFKRLNNHMYGKELFTRYTVREHLAICVCVCVCVFLKIGFEGGMWDFIVLVSDHCLSLIMSYN